MLVSQRSTRLASLSLTAPPPQPTPGEAAITRLLRALHAPLATVARSTAGAPSFLSAGLPRDRRGRIAQKADPVGAGGTGAGAGAVVGRRERERERWRMRMEADEDVYDRMGMGGGARAGGVGSYGSGGGSTVGGSYGNAGLAGYGGGYGYGYGAAAAGRYALEGDFWEEGEADTPRVGVTFADPGRERDKELLESLR